MKKTFCAFLTGGILTLSILVSTACFGGSTSNGENSGAEPQYTVSFDTGGGSAIADIKGAEGTAIGQVSTTKKDYIFMGWYSDSEKTQQSTVPSYIPAHNVKLYAKWETARNYFLATRAALNSATCYEYDFNLSVQTKFGAAGVGINGPTAVIDGNVKYDAKNDVSYLKKEENSGALLSDGTAYYIKSGSTLKKIKQNGEGKIYEYSEETVSPDFKYETSMYAKALFEFEDADIQAVSETSQQGVYKIQYSQSASGKLVSGVFNILESSILRAFVNLPNINDTVECTVSFQSGNIRKYHYAFTATVAGQSATVSYDLTMKSVGKGLEITSPNFAGLATSGTALSSKINEVAVALNNYRALETSGYRYDVKTAVDYPGANTINSRSQGRTMRKVEGGTVYFWNRLEVDSDYKNADLYKNDGIKDYERYRARIANGDVYDREDGYLSNPVTKVECSDAQQRIDEYYFLPEAAFFNAGNISMVQYSTTATEKTYSFGLRTEGVQKYLEWINACTRLDVSLAKNIAVYPIANDSLSVKGVQFDVVLSAEGKLRSITVRLKGTARGEYGGTSFGGDYSFELIHKIEVNDKAENYVVPATGKDIVLPNS